METGTIVDFPSVIWEKDGTFCVMPQSLQARQLIDEMTDEGRGSISRQGAMGHIRRGGNRVSCVGRT